MKFPGLAAQIQSAGSCYPQLKPEPILPRTIGPTVRHGAFLSPEKLPVFVAAKSYGATLLLPQATPPCSRLKGSHFLPGLGSNFNSPFRKTL